MSAAPTVGGRRSSPRFARAHVEVGGRTVGYLDSARDHTDLPVLAALHGFTGDHTTWIDLATALAPAWRTVALDLPGHGATTWSRRDPPCTLERSADLVVGALERLGVRRPALLGYSMGGRLALYAALRHRDRFASLVVESASAGVAEAGQRARRRSDDEALALRIVAGGIERFVDAWESQPLFASQRRLQAQVLARLRRQRLRCSPEGLAASLCGMGAGAQAWLGDRLSEVTRPVLIVAGGLDAKYRALADAMGAAIPGARVEIVAGAGHAVHLEEPDRYHRLVADFLSASARETTQPDPGPAKPGGMPCR